MAGLFVLGLAIPGNVVADEITIEAASLYVAVLHSSLHLEGAGFVLDAPGNPIPPTTPDVIRVRVLSPFTLEGHVSPPDSFPNRALTFLVGNGTTSVDLPWTGAETGWKFQQAFYTFGATQPAPEPSTLVLLGTGTFAYALTRRRRSRHRV